MKRKVISVLIAAMTALMVCSVCAAPSISQFIPENPVVIEGSLQPNEILMVQNANPSAYKDKRVAEAVERANDENTVTTIKEILTILDVDTSQNVRAENGQIVNPTLYEMITPFADLVIRKGDEVKYESDGTIKASVTFEPAKEMNKDDLLLMQIDPNTGKVYFIVPDELDPVTGAITAKFPTLGPIALLKKVPIVVKDVSPEKYESEIAAAVVTEYMDQKADISFDDVLDSLGIKRNDETGENVEIQLNDEVAVNRDDYTSAMGFADLAIKQGAEDYLYDMGGSLEAEANRDLNEVDWERMVLSEYPDFDVEAAREDPTLLEELEPFVLKDSFIMQINPITGEEEYIYEPEIFFAYAEKDEETEEAEQETEAGETGAEDTEETEEDETKDDTEKPEDEYALVKGWNVEDEDRTDVKIPNLVIRAEFRSMGPFAIFMNKSTSR